jgi:multiple sugar transport system substrate-binding protein
MKVTTNRRAILKSGAALAAGLTMGLHAPYVRAQSKTLSMTVFGPNQKAIEWLNGVLAEFKAQQGYDVELRQSDWGTAFQKVLTAAASHTMSDITMMGQVMTPVLASQGAFLPIDDRLAGWSETGKFYPAMLADGTYEGKSYALPIYADVRTSVYRSDILEQVGVCTDALPQTWDDFKALAQKLAKKNGGPLDAPFFANQDTAVGLMQAFSQMLYQAGGSFFDPSGKSSFGNEAGIRALDYLVSFFSEGLANPNLIYRGTGLRPLPQGTAAMALSGVFEDQNAVQNAPEVAKSIVAGLPLKADANGTPQTIAWIAKLGIASNTKDPDGSWALLSHLTSKANSEKFAEYWGALPSRNDLTDAPFLDAISPGFVSATQYAGALPTSPYLVQVQQEINTALQGAIRQSGGSAHILADLDAKIDKITAGQA